MELIKKLIFKYSHPELFAALKLISRKFTCQRNRKRGFARDYSVSGKVTEGPVLIISPHADDEVIGMGGALIGHLLNKHKVIILYLTDGRYDSFGLGIQEKEMAEIRKKEAEAIGRQYNIIQEFWDIEDSCLNCSEQNISRMIALLNNIRPTIIYLPSFFDAHYDHFAANALLSEALKRMRVFDSIIAAYEVHDDILFPNYILDITSTFEKKVELLKYYKTPLSGYDYIKLCKFRNALRYCKYINSSNNGYAEAYLRLGIATFQALYNNYFTELNSLRSNLLPRKKFLRFNSG